MACPEVGPAGEAEGGGEAGEGSNKACRLPGSPYHQMEYRQPPVHSPARSIGGGGAAAATDHRSGASAGAGGWARGGIEPSQTCFRRTGADEPLRHGPFAALYRRLPASIYAHHTYDLMCD